MDLQDAIRNSYLAYGFNEEQLEMVAHLAERRSFSAGEAIVRQFDEDKDLMLLVSGAAEIRTIVGEPIGVVKPGMPMGEVSFLDDKPRSVSIVCTSDAEVLVWAAEPLRQILREHPDIALRALLNISRVLCARLRGANNNIAALLAIDESESR